MYVSPFASVACRVLRPERMDQPELEVVEHERALRGLGHINRISRSATVLWRPLAELARQMPGDPIRVLDLASGGGDIVIALARRATRAKLNLRIDGCDRSLTAVRFARRRAVTSGVPARFLQRDVLHDPLPDGYHAIMCSLFLHHLDEADARGLLERMARACGRLVLVDDLIRCRMGYWLAWLGCRLLSRSRVVHFDGPVSAAAAFSMDEALTLARQAGLDGVTMRKHWPERFLLSWSKP